MHAPPREEWDFSSVPECELEACAAWEFPRSIPQYRRAVELERAKRNKKTPCLEKEMPSGPPPFYLGPEVQFVQWPDTPYQLLPPGVVDEWFSKLDITEPSLKELEAERLDDVCAWMIEDIDQRGLSLLQAVQNAFGPEIGDGSERILFHIDWSSTNTALIEQFTNWLEYNRPQEVKQVPEIGARSPTRQIRARLKELGAYRLLEKLRWEEALLHTQEILGGKGLYGESAGSWRRAKKSAEVELQQWWNSANG